MIPIVAQRRERRPLSAREDPRWQTLRRAELDRVLGLEIVRVTEATAIAAARLRGRGDEAAADEAAIDAMYRELAQPPASRASSSSARAR